MKTAIFETLSKLDITDESTLSLAAGSTQVLTSNSEELSEAFQACIYWFLLPPRRIAAIYSSWFGTKDIWKENFFGFVFLSLEEKISFVFYAYVYFTRA